MRRYVADDGRLFFSLFVNERTAGATGSSTRTPHRSGSASAKPPPRRAGRSTVHRLHAGQATVSTPSTPGPHAFELMDGHRMATPSSYATRSRTSSITSSANQWPQPAASPAAPIVPRPKESSRPGGGWPPADDECAIDPVGPGSHSWNWIKQGADPLDVAAVEQVLQDVVLAAFDVELHHRFVDRELVEHRADGAQRHVGPFPLVARIERRAAGTDTSQRHGRVGRGEAEGMQGDVGMGRGRLLEALPRHTDGSNTWIGRSSRSATGTHHSPT